MDGQKCDLCRLCLGSIDGCDEILLNDDHDLIKSILTITGVQVASDPGQREHLCSQCHLFLQQCVEFRMICVNNDGVFREMMSSSNHVEDGESEPKNPAVEYIKHEPIELEEPFHDASEALESNHELQHEVVEPAEWEQKSERESDAVAELTKAKKLYSRKISQCQQCGKLVEHCKMDEHREIHDPNRRKLSCPYCSKAYVKRQNLQDHIHANHTQGVQYGCDECGKSYTTRHSFVEHQLVVHSGEKRYACAVCGEKFARGSTRSYHQRTAHSTLRPFACELCEKTFKTKSHLTDHVRYHMGHRKKQQKRQRRRTSKKSTEQQ